MSLYSTLYSGYYHLNLMRKGSHAPSMRREMDTLQWCSAQVIADHQRERLDRLLETARRAPATRARLRAAGMESLFRGWQDWDRLPPIHRGDLQRDREGMVPEGRDPRLLTVNTTGGSTGEPVSFYQDQRYWDHMVAAELLVTSWWGVRPGDRTAGLWGADREFRDQPLKERLALRLQRLRGLNAFRFDETTMEVFAKDLRRWRPTYVLGYAGVLDVFARFLIERRIEGIRPRAVRSSAEILHPEARQRIGRAFGAPVFDFYGCREVNCLAAECTAHEGLHLLSYGRIVEVVDASGRPCLPGQTGRVVVTDLYNEGMPLLRYATGDLAVPAEGDCPCGRGYPRLSRIVGRESDFVVTPEGKRLHGEVFSHLFYHVAGVRRFQVVQLQIDALEVMIEVEPSVPSPDLHPLIEEVSRLVGPSVRASVRVVETIPPAPSGKHKFVISCVTPTSLASNPPP